MLKNVLNFFRLMPLIFSFLFLVIYKQFSTAGQKHPFRAVACDILASFEWNSFHFFTQPKAWGKLLSYVKWGIWFEGCERVLKIFQTIMLWTLQWASLSSAMIFYIHVTSTVTVTVTVMVIVIIIVIMRIYIINNNVNLCCATYCRVAWENTWYQSCLDIIAKLMEWENP